MLEDFEPLATGREQSLLAADVEKHRRQISNALAGSRVLVIGAAGSIGSYVARELCRFSLGALVLVDTSENNLVETVRDLRSSTGLTLPAEFTALPLALGSREFSRFLKESAPFSYVFNLSAMKHVRTEKDVYCLMRMVETNVLILDQLMRDLKPGCRKVFSVSSDKAVNPANFLGATKMAMEAVLNLHGERFNVSSARFANVAFSDGSLLNGWLKRIEKRQPIAAPTDVRRYFMSHQEAGQLCLLSGVLGLNREVFFPKLDGVLKELTFSEIATALLGARGYEPVLCESEREAIDGAKAWIAQGKWPCLFAPSNTSGEKAYEEFYTADDYVDRDRFSHVWVSKWTNAASENQRTEEFLNFARSAQTQDSALKVDYERELMKVVPSFRHIETGKSLDSKL